MNIPNFQKSLRKSLDDLGISPSAFRDDGDEISCTIDGVIPVKLKIEEYPGEVDIFIQVGNHKKIVSAWKSQMSEAAKLSAESIYYLASKRSRKGYRLRKRAASQGLTSKQARIIALSLQPMIQVEGRTAANIASVIKRVTQLVKSLSREPKSWQKFKEMVGAGKESLSATDLGKLIWDWSIKGKKLIKDLVKKVTETFPLSLYFVPKNKIPTLTDLLNLILDKAPDSVRNALSKVNEKVVLPLSDALDKYLPNLQRPLIAALFAWIWINVAEISWDFKDLIKGFTGSMSLAELFSTLPESGIGLIFAMFGVGYHLLPVMVAARILWLVGNHFLEWKGGKIIVRWDKMGLSEEKPTTVTVM